MKKNGMLPFETTQMELKDIEIGSWQRGGGLRWCEIGKGDQEVQTPSYKIDKSWGLLMHNMWNIVNKIILTL